MESKKSVMIAQTFSFTALFGSVASLLSWLLSRVPISVSESTKSWSGLPSVAVAGFPFKAVELPPSPMGADMIPREMLGGVLLNYLFWYVIAFFLAIVLLRTKRIQVERLWLLALILAGFFTFANVILFMIWFD